MRSAGSSKRCAASSLESAGSMPGMDFSFAAISAAVVPAGR